MPRKKKKEHRVQLVNLNVEVPRLLVHGSLQQLGDRSIFDTTYTVELKRDVMSSIIPTLLVGQKNKTNVDTKVQATCFLHLLGNEKKEFKQYVKCWMNKYLGSHWKPLLETDEAKTLSMIMIRDVFI